MNYANVVRIRATKYLLLKCQSVNLEEAAKTCHQEKQRGHFRVKSRHLLNSPYLGAHVQQKEILTAHNQIHDTAE